MGIWFCLKAKFRGLNSFSTQLSCCSDHGVVIIFLIDLFRPPVLIYLQLLCGAPRRQRHKVGPKPGTQCGPLLVRSPGSPGCNSPLLSYFSTFIKARYLWFDKLLINLASELFLYNIEETILGPFNQLNEYPPRDFTLLSVLFLQWFHLDYLLRTLFLILIWNEIPYIGAFL